MTRPWRLAKALVTLRAQIDRQWPDRSRVSDGTIGDERHATTDSDHNPWVLAPDGDTGIVTALDITHDPAYGVNAPTIADALIRSHDPRIKYVISNRRIARSYPHEGTPPWAWATYDGTNPHTRHFHISVQPDPRLYDDTRPWTFLQEDDVTPQDIERIADRVVTKLLARHLDNPRDMDGSTASLETWVTYRLARSHELRALADRVDDALNPPGK